MSIKDEIEALKGRINQVEGIVQALKDQLSQLESRYQQETEQQQTVKSSLKANTPRDTEKKKVRIDESANITSIIKENASSGAVSIEKSNPPPSATPATEGSESIFEIREFVDDENNAQQYELLDVTKQLQYMEQMYKNSLDSSSASTQQLSEEEELIRELAMIADKKAESIKNKQLQDNLKSSVSSDKPVVEDVDDLIDVLDKLDVRQRKRDKPKAAATSGWKAGFLSSSPAPTTPAVPTTIVAPRRSTDSLPAPPPTALPPQPAPVVITKEDGGILRDLNVAISPPKTAASTPVSVPQSTEKAPTPRPVKKAFNGVVLEKF